MMIVDKGRRNTSVDRVLRKAEQEREEGPPRRLALRSKDLADVG